MIFNAIKNSNVLKKCSILLLSTSIFIISCDEDLSENDVAEQSPTENIQLEEFSLSANPSNFYTLPTSFRRTVNFKTQYNVDNSFNTNDSEKLQRAIDELSNSGGGKLIIPRGNYSFNGVSLKNNVHIEVNKNAIFKPFNTSGRRALLMFLFTSTNRNQPLRNTSISCSNGRFRVDLNDVRPLGRGFRFCNFRNADGFLVSNVNVLDNHTQFSAFVFNGETINNRAYGPKNGVVKNAITRNSDYGYGLVQMQLGKNILFKNISGIGGATLRLEPHNKNLRTLDAVNVLDNVVGRGVSCTEGNSAVMLSPHFVTNGVVDIRNITSIRCGTAVRLERGFITSDERAFGITNVGTFDSRSIIRNVKVTYITR